MTGVQTCALPIYHRTKLSISEYEEILSNPVEIDEEGNATIDVQEVSPQDFVFVGVDQHRRQYDKASNVKQ